MNRLCQVAMGVGLCLCTAGIAEAQGGGMVLSSISMPGLDLMVDWARQQKAEDSLFAGINLTTPQQDSLKKIKASQTDEQEKLQKNLSLGDSVAKAQMQTNAKKWMDVKVALLTPEQKAIYTQNVAAQANKDEQGDKAPSTKFN